MLARLGRVYCVLLAALTILCLVNVGLMVLAALVGYPLPWEAP